MLKIAIAKTPKQIDEVLKLRHQVLTPQGDGNGAARWMDRFDTYPVTSHLVAIEKNQVIGSLRLTFDSDAGMPSDVWSDLRAVVPEDSTLMCCDLHCVKDPAESIHTTMGMLLVASYMAIAENVTHMIASVNLESIERLKSIGFRTLICEGTQESGPVTLVPLILDIRKDLKDSFVQFSKRNELQDLMHAYGCALYQPGESILKAGATGNCAFVIGEGEVVVKHPGNDEIIDTMGPGEVFGELALLTDQVRSADIIAKTEVRTMVLEKSVFVDYLMAEPKAALKLLTSVGHRMKHLIDYCNSLAA